MHTIDEPVEVVGYDAQWPVRAAAESTRIARALAIEAAHIEHIGSTAVSGLDAKPTIDLMLGVDVYPAAALEPALVALGYEALGEAGVAGRSYFRLRRHAAHFNLHVVLEHGEHWRNNLALRDYLRGSAPARRRYAAAKRAAIAAGATTLLNYSQAKADLVAALLQEAVRDNPGR